MTNQEYIEHEVQIRVHEARFNGIDGRFTAIDKRFDHMERRFDKLEAKFNWGLTLVLTGLLLPMVRHYFGF